MKKACLIAAALLLPVSAAAAELWDVKEGRKGAVTGIWQVNLIGSSLTGSATMRDPKTGPVTYALAGEIRDGKIVVQRIAPSDKTACVYVFGDPFARQYNGAAICAGEQMVWRVARRK